MQDLFLVQSLQEKVLLSLLTDEVPEAEQGSLLGQDHIARTGQVWI